MSDSDKTNELDNYGVWVKKPPRTVSSEIEENMEFLSDSGDISDNTDSSGIDSDLPDFSAIDVVDEGTDGDFGADETALSADELANIAEMGAMPSEQEASSPLPSGESEEISLDEFIEGGVFEGDEQNSSPASTPAESTPAEETVDVSEEFGISNDSSEDSGVSSDVSVSDSPSISDAPSLSDEGPIDIDLSFDDSASSAPSSPSSSSAPVADVPGSEEVDLSDFGIDFGDDSSSSGESSSVSDDGSESVDLSEFGVDFSDGDTGSSEAAPAQEPEASAPKINDDGTEEISLDSFGFDINAENEPQPAESSPSESKEENEGFSVSADDSETESAATETEAESLPETEISGGDADEVPSLSMQSESSESSSEEESSSVFTTQDDDDFDLDSIMDSIQDENGEITSLNDAVPEDSAEPAAESEAVPEETVDFSEPAETIESDSFVSEEVPLEAGDVAENAATEEVNSFETEDFSEPVISEELEEPVVTEEPAIQETIDVVDMEEPVFEETSVDLSETAVPETDSFESAETADIPAENPFELPPDDAFTSTSSVSEEATIVEEPVAEESISFTEPEISEEAPAESTSEEVFEDSITEPEAEVAFEEPVVEESINEVEESLAENQPVEEEPTQESEAAPEAAKQDAEISAAANSILSQIASELSSLRSEISNLKTEFEELKNKEASAPALPTTEAVEETESSFDIASEETAEQESSGGFFSDDDEDDTIALSLDEMDNILNTVELVEENAQTIEAQSNESSEAILEEPEEVASNEEFTETAEEEAEESLDFSNDSIEEPILDNIDTNVADEDLPEEILVPKTDDILVESSSENLIGEENSADSLLEGEEEALVFDSSDSADLSSEDAESDSPAFEVETEPAPAADDSTSLVDEPFVFEEEDSQEAVSAESNEVSEPESEPEAEIEVTAEEETVAEGDSTESEAEYTEDETDSSEEESSGISISEHELDNLLSSEAALADENNKYLEEEERADPVQSSIPVNLQKEIKSVLSYMDQLLENLPEEKIAEFAQSEQFETYKKLFKELGLD